MEKGFSIQEMQDMEKYLATYYYDKITDLLNDNNTSQHVALAISFNHLRQSNLLLFQNTITNIHSKLNEWNRALLTAQKKIIDVEKEFLENGSQIKAKCHVRFVDLPVTDAITTIRNNDYCKRLVQVMGNIVRMTQVKLLEYKRRYFCKTCNETIVVEAEYARSYIIEPPQTCPNSSCKGVPYQKSVQPDFDYCMDFQEIRLQELLGERNIPASLVVTIDNDLVGKCQPGDCVTICGTIERRWKPVTTGKRTEASIILRAISVLQEDEKQTIAKDFHDDLLCVQADWQEFVQRHGELKARDLLIGSISPDVHGMHLVKLSIALALCSGGQRQMLNGVISRGNAHVLLVGDPGLAKSKLLKFASNISIRSVRTTGMGCSAAGLTAAAVFEDGEWQLEPGALVLADGGVCCIDEFNLMRGNDRTSIHEAMEQQAISIAKAGLVCKLSSRCIVLASTNPKSYNTVIPDDGEEDPLISIGISSPLLSRFDIVLILRDKRSIDWDTSVTTHLLNSYIDNSELTGVTETNGNEFWNLKRLQSHFLATHNVVPELTADAEEILSKYYKLCRNDILRDNSRTTARLLDCLVRLSQAHARLLLRKEVRIEDALTVIQLMESTWGFGRILAPFNAVKKCIPLGPSDSEVQIIYNKLGLVWDPSRHSIDCRQIGSQTVCYNQNISEISISCTGTRLNTPLLDVQNTVANGLCKSTIFTDADIDLNNIFSRDENKRQSNISRLPLSNSQSFPTPLFKSTLFVEDDLDLDKIFSIDENIPCTSAQLKPEVKLKRKLECRAEMANDINLDLHEFQYSKNKMIRNVDTNNFNKIYDESRNFDITDIKTIGIELDRNVDAYTRDQDVSCNSNNDFGVNLQLLNTTKRPTGKTKLSNSTKRKLFEFKNTKSWEPPNKGECSLNIPVCPKSFPSVPVYVIPEVIHKTADEVIKQCYTTRIPELRSSSSILASQTNQSLDCFEDIEL